MNHSNLPSKLKDIKNQVFLNNCYDPINKKYVKKVWAHKLTKLGREKRDLIWEYYKYRKRWSVTYRMKESFQKNVREVTLIYFDDPVQHRFTITQEHMNIMKAYDKGTAHTISLKLTRKTENDEKTGYRWDMITEDEFNVLPLSDKIINEPVVIEDYASKKMEKQEPEKTESESEEEKEDVYTTDENAIRKLEEEYDEMYIKHYGGEQKEHTDESSENDEEENNIPAFDDIDDYTKDDAMNDDVDEIEEEDPLPNLDYNDLPDVVRTNDGVTNSIGNMIQDIMDLIHEDYYLRQYKVVNINDRIWLNISLKAKDGKIIFLKKLRVIKEQTKELLDKGFTLSDGSIVHLYWTDPVRNKKKRRNVHKNDPQPDNSKKTKKQRRKVKRATRAKKGHIHMKILHN